MRDGGSEEAGDGDAEKTYRFRISAENNSDNLPRVVDWARPYLASALNLRRMVS